MGTDAVRLRTGTVDSNRHSASGCDQLGGADWVWVRGERRGGGRTMKKMSTKRSKSKVGVFSHTPILPGRQRQALSARQTRVSVGWKTLSGGQPGSPCCLVPPQSSATGEPPPTRTLLTRGLRAAPEGRRAGRGSPASIETPKALALVGAGLRHRPSDADWQVVLRWEGGGRDWRGYLPSWATAQPPFRVQRRRGFEPPHTYEGSRWWRGRLRMSAGVPSQK